MSLSASCGAAAAGGAQHTLDVYVSRLRKTLDADAEGHALETRPGGYCLHVGDGQLDVHRFERLVAEGRRELAVGAPAQAAASLRAALALWRGQVLADLSDEPFARVEIARLKELRLGVIEDRIESDLALGRHADLIGELKGLLSVHPLNERLRGQLMVALYRGGRQVEALEAYQSARRTLIDELGLEPSRALKELEHAILAQDGSLDPPARTAVQPPAPEPGRGRLAPGGIGRRPRLLVAAGAGLALVMALLAVGLSRRFRPVHRRRQHSGRHRRRSGRTDGGLHRSRAAERSGLRSRGWVGYRQRRRPPAAV